MNRIAIRAEELSKSFGTSRVLRGVDLAVAEGECVALLGANGAGKTTLLRCLASVLRPTSGSVWWFDRLAGVDPDDRRLVGFAAHESLLYPFLTLRENLLFAARMYGMTNPRDRTDRWLGETGLGPYSGRLPREVSRGMRQRLALARALLHDPVILLLDEPFAGLDREGREWLTDLLRDLRNRGRTICFTTHEGKSAAGLADRWVTLQSGRLQRAPGPLCCERTPSERVGSGRAA